MVVIVLALSARSFNDVETSRPARDYTVLSGTTYKQVKREDAPIGVVNEYCFQLGQIDHDDTLAFYINHHNIEVYFDEECVYTMSVTSLMTLSIALLNCVDVSADGKGSRTIRGCTGIYCLIYIVQLIFQSAGVWDLRQMLKITHAPIILSAVVLCIDSILSWVWRPKHQEEKVGLSYSWMLMGH